MEQMGIVGQREQDWLSNNTGADGFVIHREEIEARDAVEFVVYFRENGGPRERVDLWVTKKEIEDADSNPEGPGSSQYILDLMAKAVNGRIKELKAKRESE
jgi:hypothetical protein